MNKRLWGVLILLFLILPPGFVHGEEAWKEVAAVFQLAGHWEGSTEAGIPRNREMGLPKSAIAITITLEYAPGAAQVYISLKVDMERFLTDWTKMDTIQDQGMTKDSLWALMEAQFEAGENLTVAGKYFIITDLSVDAADAAIASDTDMSLLINPAGTQLRMAFTEAISFGLGDEGFQEIILYKIAGAVL
jgi:hypothetical protein